MSARVVRRKGGVGVCGPWSRTSRQPCHAISWLRVTRRIEARQSWLGSPSLDAARRGKADKASPALVRLGRSRHGSHGLPGLATARRGQAVMALLVRVRRDRAWRGRHVQPGPVQVRWSTARQSWPGLLRRARQGLLGFAMAVWAGHPRACPGVARQSRFVALRRRAPWQTRHSMTGQGEFWHPAAWRITAWFGRQGRE